MHLDDTTDAMFQAVMIEEDWDRALKIMADAASGASILLANGIPNAPGSFIAYTANFDHSVYRSSQFSAESHFDPRTNPAIPQVYGVPAGKSYDRRSFICDEDFYKVAFNNEIMFPQGLYNFQVVKLTHTSDIISGGFISLPGQSAPMEASFVERVESWLPALRVILAMEAKLRAQTAKTKGLQTAIDHLDRGVLVIDASLKILSMNTEAERIFRDSTTVSSVSGKVRLRPQEAHAAFDTAVRRTAYRRGEQAIDCESIFCSDQDGRHRYELTVLPADGVGRHLGTAAGVATVVIEDHSRLRDLPPVDALRARFGLTPMQAKVTQMALLPFASKRELAEKLGLEESTVRSHLAAAREAVGGNNLHEFVQLAAGIHWRTGND